MPPVGEGAEGDSTAVGVGAVDRLHEFAIQKEPAGGGFLHRGGCVPKDKKDIPVNGTSATVFRLMSDS